MNEIIIRLIVPIVLLAAMVAGGLLVQHKAFKQRNYKCLKCTTVYKPTSFARAFWARDGGNHKRLDCPTCNKKEWAEAIKIEDGKPEENEPHKKS